MEGILLGLDADFAIEQVIQEPHHCIIVARSVVFLSCCPFCSSPSERAHSQYQRTVADLPCGGCRVTLKLIVRRFFCHNDQCPRRIFAERFPQLLLPYAQMTNRLRRYLQPPVLVVDEIGYTRLTAEQSNFFFELVRDRYEKGAIILTSNTSFSEWGSLLNDEVLATALLDRLLHHVEVISISGKSFRMKDRMAASKVAAK